MQQKAHLPAPVAVVIPTWNGRALLAECLQGLSASTVRPEVVVVDNGSADGTAEWLRAEYSQVRVIRNPRNLGFAAAVNQGIRATTTPWVAPLNNDAVPEPDWLAELVAIGESDRRIGAVATRMMFRDAPDLISSAGIRVYPSGGVWDLLIGEPAGPADPIEIFGASGGACLYRREMLQDIGLFDDAFFAYLEDVDLAWRARLRGWKAILAPNAVVYHALSATMGEDSPFKRYYLPRNKWRVIVRNYPIRALVANLPTIVLYEGLLLGYGLVRRDWTGLLGRLDTLKHLPSLLKQRREIQARQTTPWRDLRRLISPLESPSTLRRRAQRISRLATRKS